MPYRNDNDALRAQLEVVKNELKDAGAKNKLLSKKLNRIRVSNTAVAIALVVSAIGGFFGGAHMRWPSKQDAPIASNDNRSTLRQPHPGNFSPYSALVDEKDFYQKLMKTNYKAGLIWETAIKYAEINKERLLFVGDGSFGQGIFPIAVEAPSRDEWGVERHLVVGKKLEHPYGSYKVEPQLVFYAFGGSPRYGIRMIINPNSTEEFAVLAGNPMGDYWKPMSKKEVSSDYKEKELGYWATALRLKEQKGCPPSNGKFVNIWCKASL